MNLDLLPNEFKKNIKDVFHLEGEKWLNNLPYIIKHYEKTWNIQYINFPSNLTYSFVSFVTYQGKEALLKMYPPHERAKREILWYQESISDLAPKLLQYDLENSTFLLQRLSPGSSLKDEVKQDKDDFATHVIAKIVTKLRKQKKLSSHKIFPHVQTLQKDIEILKDKIPNDLFHFSLSTFKSLIDAPHEDILLHGDIHHDNILKDKDDWKLIDPHGYIGPIEFEIGAMIRNPYDFFPKKDSLQEVLEKRLRILTENLPFPKSKILYWSLLYTVISLGWSLKDHDECPQENLEIAKQLYQKIKKEIP